MFYTVEKLMVSNDLSDSVGYETTYFQPITLNFDYVVSIEPYNLNENYKVLNMFDGDDCIIKDLPNFLKV